MPIDQTPEAHQKQPDELLGDPFATFTEWDGDADRKAYADL